MDEKFLRLTNITYQLLEYFPENDSLKNRAKEKVLVVMEGLVLASGGDFNQAKLSEDIKILLGYLKVGKIQGWISSINYLIIYNEYQKIIQQNNFGKMQIQKEVFVSPKIEEVIDESGLVEKFSEKKCTQKNVGPVLNKSGALKKKPRNFKFSDRQQKIIEFLSDKEKAQVMDLQAVLPTVTKRTIRRDLDELLSVGEIVRMGEFNQVFYCRGQKVNS